MHRAYLHTPSARYDGLCAAAAGGRLGLREYNQNMHQIYLPPPPLVFPVTMSLQLTNVDYARLTAVLVTLIEQIYIFICICIYIY